MRPITTLLLILVLQPAFGAEDLTAIKTVLPVGALSKSTKITWDEVDTSQSYFLPSSSAGSYDKASASSLVNIKSIENSSLSETDTRDLQSRISDNSLVLQKSELLSVSPNCTSGSAGCVLQDQVPAYSSSMYDLIGKFFSKLNPANWFKSREKNVENSNRQVAQAMTDVISKGNSIASGSVKPPCDSLTSAAAAPTGATNQCGVQQALKSFRENKGKIDQDVIVYNDFSDGEKTGKMWILNADGTAANIIGKNPIDVSRGVGGFGSGMGSKKTPHGAIMTRPYSPPRAGNINDGITLVGLESDNRDIESRGVLLHGWDPFGYTAGCLGVSGAIDTDAKGRKVLGSPPPYLDELKQRLFSKGSVMIYNFTPTKKNECK